MVSGVRLNWFQYIHGPMDRFDGDATVPQCSCQAITFPGTPSSHLRLLPVTRARHSGCNACHPHFLRHPGFGFCYRSQSAIKNFQGIKAAAATFERRRYGRRYMSCHVSSNLLRAEVSRKRACVESDSKGKRTHVGYGKYGDFATSSGAQG